MQKRTAKLVVNLLYSCYNAHGKEVDQMKLSDKIQSLRKSNGYSQEGLASVCNVSRQSVSKWESGISLPETDKLIILSDLFQVTVDVLIKDELSINGIKEVSTCGSNAVKKEKATLYEGAIIKESIEDECILDYMRIHKVELWNTGGSPKYWTVIFFTSDVPNFPQLASEIMIADPKRGGNWFVDFKSGNTKYIVFKNKILKYDIGNITEKNLVLEKCRELGISDKEMKWQE